MLQGKIKRKEMQKKTMIRIDDDDVTKEIVVPDEMKPYIKKNINF